ncbi:MAG: GIY-YIG nuclease family protein [Pseudomonadota bacterium]|nr:GIY-YIG nuclease family protein [Pseudomonadota bacterium]|tara:strand:- start:12 stop:413 length:402 start_codon:yes stop_codon:yes gene_type:complete
MTKQPCVYILASKRNGTLYIGVTINLIQRIWEHKNDLVPGFTQRYRIHHLVYFKQTADMLTAIAREKQLKALEPPVDTQPDRANQPPPGLICTCQSTTRGQPHPNHNKHTDNVTSDPSVDHSTALATTAASRP